MNEMIGRTQVSTEGAVIVVERLFDAPRSRVFEIWTSAEHLKQWWGPRTFPTTYCTVDFCAGGTWHYCMTGPNGEQSWGISLYEEIVVPDYIVYTDAFSNADGTINPDMPQFRIRVDFVEQSGKTRVLSTSYMDSEEQVKQLVEMGMAQGVAETWDRMEEYLEALSR